ncbi:threonine--tRNA ligase, partial [candidate division WOR-3 bacterium]|nr:threonine--tRNA ligase [candidate division WOR-3 bacterium]
TVGRLTGTLRDKDKMGKGKNEVFGKKIYWHSTAHIMAQAVKELFPDVKLGIGPAIESGFYYDFDCQEVTPDSTTAYTFTPEDLEKIEKRMREIIKKDYKFVRKEIKKSEAISLFKKLKEDYKLELLNELNKGITIYSCDNFIDLCEGPHIPSTGRIKAFKLLKVAGAYWRGNEKNPMLQRIYGVSYPSQRELDEHLKKLEEAKERDHRKIGKELDLFNIFEEAGPGLVCWTPKGTIIKEIIEAFWKEEHLKRGYQLISSPHIAKTDLWKTSGHYEYHYEGMAELKFGNENYVLKPMNCLFHILTYKTRIRSYKELPIRYAELGTVYRYERSGVLHGLMRVRGFTQDDAHIFCREDQMVDELTGVLELAQYMIKTFKFTGYQVDLSVREPGARGGYAGSDEDWEKAEETLVQVLEAKKLDYKRVEGEAVFYGPKIDIKLFDAIGRAWQGPTIQLDFNLPQRFNITYIGKDNKPHQVFLIHRTVLGAMERFIGCLIEHYKGAFPIWLSPVQVAVATISQDLEDYANEVTEKLKSHDIRVQLLSGAEKIGFKIREASLMKIPYILIIGKREKIAKNVSIRERGKGDIGSFKLDTFINLLTKRIRNKD